LAPNHHCSSDYDALINALYKGPLEDTPWQSFLPLFGQFMQAMAVSLVLRLPAAGDSGLILNYQRSKNGDLANTELADPSSWPISAYREHFFTLDPFIRLPPGQVVTLAELMPEQELLASDYYQHYLEPAGVFHIIGTDTSAPGGLMARLRISRGKDEAPFNEDNKAFLRQLVPHLRLAIQIHARLSDMESERNLYANAVNRLAVGTIILDEHGNILKTNELATQLLQQKDGVSESNGKLVFARHELNSEFNSLLAQVLSPAMDSKPGMAEALRVARSPGRADLGLIIRPVPTTEWPEGQSRPTIVIFISDPEQQSDTSQQIITRLFGFTPAEAALAMQLARGLSLAQASAELNISQHTARAQLKAIFAKTGVSRQAELVRLVVKSVANLG
jgi:DNA-binding CsgD family transcriptional regulator/PAS domain-containing protein